MYLANKTIMIRVKIVNTSKHPLPAYATFGSAGFDIRANLDAPVELPALGRALIPTGLYMQIPEGNELQIRPRSGLANKHGVTVLNSPGTIDEDFRGMIQILLINLSREPFTVQDGERIAQGVFTEYKRGVFFDVQDVKHLSNTDRGTAGFGSTGTK